LYSRPLPRVDRRNRLGCRRFFVEAREEYARLKSIQAENRRLVADAELRLKYQEKVLERLSSDPSYVDKVIRRKLGYARPEEFVFRFSEN
jgi:cell division protein FtsB